MNGEHLREVISDSIKPFPNPAVFISGGLDSTILLHHLAQKVKDPIHTFTHYWGTEEDETEQARAISEHYGTIHHELKIENIIESYREIIQFVERPHRFAFYWLFLYAKVQEIGCMTVYVGEGLDEHFGGYWYKPELSPQEYWSGISEYAIPTHQFMSVIYGLHLQIPFLRLPLEITLPFYDKRYRNKTILRNIYRGIVPDCVIDSMKYPGRTPWLKIWAREVKPHIQGPIPKTRIEAQNIIEKWVINEWLKYPL